MCNEFVCTLSKTCISEPVCDTSRCPYTVVNACNVCVLKNVCKTNKEAKARRSAPHDPLSRKR